MIWIVIAVVIIIVVWTAPFSLLKYGRKNRSVTSYYGLMAVDRLDAMILMFDENDAFWYMNESARKIFHTEMMTRMEFWETWTRDEEEDEDTLILCRGNVIRYFKCDEQELRSKKGRLRGYMYILHEFTQERELQEKYRHSATHDSLTDLYNRDWFIEKAEEFMKQNPNEVYYIICSDIKQFKAFNEVFGVEAGDRLLKMIAEELRRNDDHNRVYGRVGDDSFAMCIPKKNFSDVAYLVKSSSVLRARSYNFPIANHIGIYEVTDLNLSVSAMMDRATLAIASIKGDIQQEIARYDDSMRKELLQEQEILTDLQTAFNEKEFVIYLQPQISHETKAIVGAETLVRWQHPKKGLIPPYLFIPVMENNGLISKLDMYVWEMACAQIRKWTDEGRNDISLSVNISPKDFYYLDLYKVIMDLVTKYDISPSRLRLEITESAFAIDLKKQVELVEKLQDAGFIVEMDDFGSAYSTLNTLKDIPVDVLKMDMKFMAKATDADRSANIIQMIVGMADKLRMDVIAEGVETKEQADFLGSVGCDIIQGYYYAKPMPVEEFEEMLKTYEYKDMTELVHHAVKES
ncbi:MAG: GGDEF domain-containing protein [Lachnospiraceae bacterium]|nr:GGDEF domain-containing protein [Lachnospiraceae bacterium]